MQSKQIQNREAQRTANHVAGIKGRPLYSEVSIYVREDGTFWAQNGEKIGRNTDNATAEEAVAELICGRDLVVASDTNGLYLARK